MVRQLEKDWEHALAAQTKLKEDYEHYRRAQPRRLSTCELNTIRVLAASGATVTQIADRLAEQGLWPPRQNPRCHPGAIHHLIRRLGIRPGLDDMRNTAHGKLGNDGWWPAALAHQLGMPTATLFGWLQRG
ncbi:hypothetical protein AB0A77_26745 [Streptomyces varsoviensis]|uniref:hypothetical protein n=1 Tax=Streptomyces varsoviensis TaxID=67373 RepID=UPI0033DE8748